VVCPNPACGVQVPLVSSLDLGKKKGQEAWIRPIIGEMQVSFAVESGPRTVEPNKRGQGARFDCWVCGSPVIPDQVHGQLDRKNKPPNKLLAVAAVGKRRRVYLPGTSNDETIAASAANEADQIRAEDAGL